MLFILNFFITSIWYFIIFKKQDKQNMIPLKPIVLTVLTCMLIGAAVGFTAQLILGLVVEKFLDGVIKSFVNAFINAALIEELIKFFVGKRSIQKYANPDRVMDYILLMGAAGLGFGFFESILDIGSNPINAILSGILPFHLLTQLWMGSCYYKCKQSKDEKLIRKNLRLTLLVPIIVHGFNDFFASIGYNIVSTNLSNESTATITDAQALTVFVFFMLSFLIQVIFAIIVIRCTMRIVKSTCRRNDI